MQQLITEALNLPRDLQGAVHPILFLVHIPPWKLDNSTIVGSYCLAHLPTICRSDIAAEIARGRVSTPLPTSHVYVTYQNSTKGDGCDKIVASL
jgi:hypothetical protein